MEISHRIKKIRKAKQLSIKDFSALLAEKRQRIQDIELQRQKVPEEVLTKILLNFDDINAHWLLTGEGAMTTTNEVSEPKAEYKEAINEVTELLPDLTEQQIQKIKVEIKENIEFNKLKKMVYQKV